MTAIDPHRAWRAAARFTERRSLVWLLHHPQLRLGELADDEDLSRAWAAIDAALDRFDPDADGTIEVQLPVRWRSHPMDEQLSELRTNPPPNWTRAEVAETIAEFEADRAVHSTRLDREEIDAGIANLPDLFNERERGPEVGRLRYYAFTARTNCPGCGASVALDSPTHALECRACGEPIPVPRGALAHLIAYFEDHHPTLHDRGEDTIEDRSWQWTYRSHDEPPCPECGDPLGLAPEADRCECSRCGAQASVEPAPGWMRRQAPMATRLVTPGPRLARASETMTVACPGCGAPVAVPGARRAALTCRHCDASVILPDAIWQQIEPPTRVKGWTVELVGEPVPVTARRLWEEVEAERAAVAAAPREPT